MRRRVRASGFLSLFVSLILVQNEHDNRKKHAQVRLDRDTAPHDGCGPPPTPPNSSAVGAPDGNCLDQAIGRADGDKNKQ